MRNILALNLALILSIFFGVGWIVDSHNSPLVQSTSGISQIIPEPIVQEMIDQVSQDRLLADLRRLAGVDPLCTPQGCTTLTGRFTGSEDLDWAQDYVYETLIGLHYSVETLDWSLNGHSDQNILAHKQGFLYPNEEIYFIAHMDGSPADGPAADDDGSGAAALLELARILAPMHLSRSVTLFFSSGEEQGSLGSHSFVDAYPERVTKIKYLVSVEMLTYDGNADGAMELLNGSQPLGFVQMLQEIIQAYPIGLAPHIMSDCG